MQTIIKVILCFLFLLCLLHMPYSYYQAVRFIGLIGFALLAYLSSKDKAEIEVIIYIALALLFQPFFKLALGRIGWNVVDVVVSLALIVSIFLPSRNNTNRKL